MIRGSTDGACRLAPLQQGMLFNYLQDPRSGVDIEQFVVHLPEAIDARRMETAWQWLVRRHDVLRARIVWADVEQPCLETLASVALPFTVVRAPELSLAARRRRLRAFLECDRIDGFPLDRAPLLRLTLFEWDVAAFSLVWTFHHALLDGRTFPILLGEVFGAYEQLAAGPVPSQPAPPAYREHLAWLQRDVDAAAPSAASADTLAGRQHQFWRRLLAGVSAPTPLVIDRLPVVRAPGARRGDVRGALDPSVTAVLRALADAHGLTMNAIVMAAWAVLLHRYSGEQDVVFGATRACRKSSVADADRTIGLFINTVPVRVSLTGDDLLLAVCQSVRQQWLEMRPYEHTPLTRIRTATDMPASRPLFETLIVFEAYSLDQAMRAAGGAWAARRIELYERTNFPLALSVYDGDALAIKLAFDGARIDAAAARRMLGHLQCLLESVAANPGSTVRDVPLVGAHERRRLIAMAACPDPGVGASPLPLDGNATIGGLFEAQARLRPDAVALTGDEHALTYAQLNARANRVARALVLRGVGPEMLVALWLPRATDLVVAILAILKAGAAYLPLDQTYPAQRLAFMLEDARATLLLTQGAVPVGLPASCATQLSLEDVLAQPAQPGDEDNLDLRIAPDHLAYVIYTSGTTGKPKGSLITHRNVVRLFPAAAACFELGPQDVWTLFHSAAFDFSVWEIWGALLHGGRLVVVPYLVSRSPEAFHELVAREQVTVLSQTPSAFRQFIEADAAGPRPLSLRYIVFGGEALDLHMLRPWFEAHGDARPCLVNMYGITETTVHVTYRRLRRADLTSGSVIGVPLADLRLHVLDQQRQPVPLGVPGELYVGGPGLARGYLRRDDLTRDRFVPDPFSERPGERLYRTGDLARRLSPGDLEYIGRIDDQVKVRGFRIELGEIEAVLTQHPDVRAALVVARDNGHGTTQLIAYVIAGPEPGVTALREHLLKQLPDYMVPASFVFLAAMPLTAHGKIDRAALPAPEPVRPSLAERYVAPRSAAERAMADVWSKVLGIERIGVHDNFFELGGDSILSIQVISAARRTGGALTPQLLFANQTIAKLAAAVEGARAPALPAATAMASGTVPLTPIQAWFFGQHIEDAGHYNQAVLLETVQPLDRELLEAALATVRAQHDGLGLRYVRDATGWHQSYATSAEAVPLIWHDLSDLEQARRADRIDAIVAAAHASLDISAGPLWRVAYIGLGTDQAARLLLVVHHLVVDAVSWPPLLEDLEAAYRQLERGAAPQLAAKTSSFQLWAERLGELSATGALSSDRAYWAGLARSAAPTRSSAPTPAESRFTALTPGTVGAAAVMTVVLTRRETQALLQEVPRAYRTRINDLLLTALVRSWARATGDRTLVTDVEGHGREALFADVDVSRTVGWFTSIFPVHLELLEADTAPDWHPGHALKSIKEALRQIPRQGVGFGILRYLGAPDADMALPERTMIFNYLGQRDRVLDGSGLFRFAPESAGPCRSPRQRRSHAIELNCVVIDGRLECGWTYDPAGAAATSELRQLADGFTAALRELIEHCLSPGAGGRTPSDFPLAQLTAIELDCLVAGRNDVEDIYALSPVQTLFLSLGAGAAQAAFDQWQCTLSGPLDVDSYRAAWQGATERHSILRSTVHGEAVGGPVQLVHRDVCPPWTIEDWREMDPRGHAHAWGEFLARDRATPLPLDRAPAMRFALVRLDDEIWKFAWSVPALLLDGWSWPLVFETVSRLYVERVAGLARPLDPVRPYRDYIEWLGALDPAPGQRFWRERLAGFVRPTPLVGDTLVSATGIEVTGTRVVTNPVRVSPETSAALTAAARHSAITLSALVQGAWAILLAHQSGLGDVVFGAAFNGRPTDLDGAAEIVGPFVSNLPVRVAVDNQAAIGPFFLDLHTQSLELTSHQFTPLIEVQRASAVPLRLRLFDSLVVIQNYAVGASALALGDHVAIEDFVGPIHTNYPVLLLAEPGPPLHITLLTDTHKVAPATVGQWAADLALLLELIPGALASNAAIGTLTARLSPARPAAPAPRRLAGPSRHFSPPRTTMERTVCAVWEQLLELEPIGTNDTFFDLGGTSLLLLEVHNQLQLALGSPFPIVTLFEYPTIRALAGHLAPASDGASRPSDQWSRRADQHKKAIGRLRSRAKQPTS